MAYRAKSNEKKRYIYIKTRLFCYETRLKDDGAVLGFLFDRRSLEGSPVDPPRLLAVCVISVQRTEFDGNDVRRQMTIRFVCTQIRAIKHILRCSSSFLCPVIQGSAEIFAGRSPTTTTTCPCARCYHDSVHAPRAFLSHVLYRSCETSVGCFPKIFFNHTKRSYLLRRIYEF